MIDPNSSTQSHKKALAANRLLEDTMREGYQPQRDDVLRERCLGELRRIASLRNGRRKWSIVAAALVTFILGTIDSFYSPGHRGIKSETAFEPVIAAQPTLRISFKIKKPGFELAEVSYPELLLQKSTAGSDQTTIMSNEIIMPKSSAFTVVSNKSSGAHLQETSSLSILTPFSLIQDWEVLRLPHVAGISGGPNGVRRLLVIGPAHNTNAIGKSIAPNY